MKNDRAVTPLLEMMISILMLWFAGAVSLNIFLTARSARMLSHDKVNAMYKAQNVIEYMKISCKNGENTLYFDENWQKTSKNSAVFIVSIELDQNSGAVSCKRASPYNFLPPGSEMLCEMEFGRLTR